MASRVLPQPFSLGEVQSVQVLVAHSEAAGLLAEVADHVPADLQPDRRILTGTFDREGLLGVEYTVQPPHRGRYPFGRVDLRCWRRGGWFIRQVRTRADEPAAVFPEVSAIRRYELMLRGGMLTFSDGVRRFVAPQRGPAQVTQLNKVLYDVKAEYTEPDFSEAFAQLALRVSRRSLVVVLTDVLDPEASRDLVAHAIRLSRRHLVMVVAMSDPEVLAARDAPVERVSRAYEWAAAEELLAARRASFEQLRQGGVLGLDVEAGRLSPSLVERYLELKERALL